MRPMRQIRRGRETRFLSTVGLVCTLLVSLLAVGCGRRNEEISYQTGFGSVNELADWKCEDGGKWEIREGRLVCDPNTSGPGSVIWLDRPLGDNQRIEFEVECLQKAGDVTLLYRRPDKPKIQDVAFFVASGDSPDLEKNRVHSVRIEKRGNEFQVYIDGKRFRLEKVRGPRYRHFGFAVSQNVVCFDNLKIEKGN